MITLVRVDNRLLHGQILETWVPRLHAAAVVVADDDAAASPLARAAMTLALPRELPATIQAIAEVDWAGLAGAAERVVVLVREVADLARAVAAGLTPERCRRVNLGNIHYTQGRRPVTPSVFLSEAEVSRVLDLSRAGFEVEARAIPSDAPVGALEMERRYKAARER